MFIATIAVDLYAPKFADKSERVVIDLGLSDDDALFAYNKSWYKIANTIAKLTPYRVVVRNVQFSDADRLTLIAMAKEREREEDADFFVLTCEECGSTSVCEHVVDEYAYSADEPHHPYSY